jgi:hypothetical protein
MREVFTPYKPHAATLAVVGQANTIIEEYLAQGFALTLRQLFYQFAARACSKMCSTSISASASSSAMRGMVD